MKKIYITESMLNRIKLMEGSFKGSLSNDILSDIQSNKTSLYRTKLFNDILGNDFIEELLNDKLSSNLGYINNIQGLEAADVDSAKNLLSRLIRRCKDLEKDNKDKLEKICINYVIGMFEIPEETIEINSNLVDKVQIDNQVVNLEKEKGSLKGKNIPSLDVLKHNIEKRRIINALCMGAGLSMSSNVKSYANQIYEINPELVDLYKKITALNNFLLYSSNNLDITEDDNKQIGTVITRIGNKDEVIEVHAYGEIFPVLLCETIRGIMEVFASHGLPLESELRDEVLHRTDYLKAEPWNMRIGYCLWDKLKEHFNQNRGKYIPYWFKDICELKYNKFNKYMSEMLSETGKGSQIANMMVNKAKKEYEMDEFSDEMSKLKINKTIIQDEIDLEK